MSQNAIERLFGPLRTALSLQEKSTFMMVAVMGLCLILTLVFMLKFKKTVEDHRKMESIITDAA